MCIEWEDIHGQQEITNFIEVLSAFCICYPDDGSECFPERVAAQNARGEEPAHNHITEADTTAANRLGARRPIEGVWQPVMDRHGNAIAERLEQVAPGWQLFEQNQEEWENEIKPAIKNLLEYCLHIHGLGIASTTKLLWVKRPHLIPICDSVILGNLVGGSANTVSRAMRGIDKIRAVGQATADALGEAQEHLARLSPENAYHNLPRLRILEVLLWFHYEKPHRKEHYCLFDEG